jgi:dihydroorotate dehydrogenase electron transfer subunit
VSAPVADAAVADSHHKPSGRLWGRVAGNEPLGSLVWLTVDIPGWPGARPGQFALLQADSSGCFLARALSIAGEVGQVVSFLIAPVGEGTREICGLRPGDGVWVLGPLGNGFDTEQIAGGTRLLIVAGGVGAAPFPLLLARLTRRVSRPLPEVVVLLGFRDARQAQGAAPLLEAIFRSQSVGLSCRFAVAVEDGSHGPAEKVTDLLTRELVPGDRLFVCGPAAMSAAVWRICCLVPDVRTWFSLETGMACGVGSCHGCALTLADGSVARVCHDGPVFSGESLFGPNTTPPDPPKMGDRRS